MKKQTNKELSIPETVFIGGITQGMSGTAAVKKAYPLIKSDKYAKTKANRLITRDYIKAAIKQKKALISKITNIDSVYLSNKTSGIIETALLGGKLGTALHGIEVLAKLNGCFTDNKPNPAAQEERAKRSEKESKAIQEIVQTWLNSKYNSVKTVESVEIPQEERLSIVGDSGGNNGE